MGNGKLGFSAHPLRSRFQKCAPRAFGERLHTLYFDVDGTEENVPLEFGNGMRRWRPLRE